MGIQILKNLLLLLLLLLLYFTYRAPVKNMSQSALQKVHPIKSRTNDQQLRYAAIAKKLRKIHMIEVSFEKRVKSRH